MKEKFLRVLLHTVEFLAVIGAAVLVVKLAPFIGLGALSAEVLGIIAAAVMAAFTKYIREVKVDYVNIGKK